MTRLTSEQFALFRAKTPVERCPICGSERLEHSPYVSAMQHPLGGRPGKAPQDMRLTVVCPSCGYIMEFSATVLGILV